MAITDQKRIADLVTLWAQLDEAFGNARNWILQTRERVCAIKAHPDFEAYASEEEKLFCETAFSCSESYLSTLPTNPAETIQ